MKALTVWQPWASLIAVGAKPYEFRGWKTPRWLIGQRLAIHAGARPVRISEVTELLERLDDRESPPCLLADLARPLLQRVAAGLQDKGAPLFGDAPFRLPLSAVTCIVTVGEPKRGDLCAVEFGATAGNDSDRDEQFNWGWSLLDIEALLPPVEARGAQGLWDWNAAEGRAADRRPSIVRRPAGGPASGSERSGP